ncbi:MAG: TIGR03982 family His-Xaa-Ser system protein [Emcibacteraceae bacterium]|nr:TIGR03982 family His-Xaa-Ser system protein [Emcibacteraceae bacterium]
MLNLKKTLLVVNLVATFSCIALGIKFVAMPMIAQPIFKEEYQTLMFQCDNVMRDHLIAKNRVTYEMSDTSLKQLKAAEMGLLTCHDYDKLRKRMLSWGVTANELSFIGLEAIEKNNEDLMKYVETHQFKF